MDHDVVKWPWYHPSSWLPYLFLLIVLLPVFVGYSWLFLASFSRGTRGLRPTGGLTLDNWSFLLQGVPGQADIARTIGMALVWSLATTGVLLLLALLLKRRWPAGFAANVLTVRGALTVLVLTFSGIMLRALMRMDVGIWNNLLNTLLIAVYLTVTVVLVSSMAGYALSRMNFPGRRPFLAMTLILHGFPAVTLLIPIYFVLRFFGNVPVIGDVIGFNTLAGVALVMVAFELPLGVWLMKGFFDNIPWDTERAALVDGASHFTTWRLILMPLIRPGIFALGIFAFISGWGAFLIPVTFTIGETTSTLPVYLNGLIGDTAPISWGTVAAVGLFQMIPVLAFFVFAQEYLLNIFAGGSKGAS